MWVCGTDMYLVLKNLALKENLFIQTNHFIYFILFISILKYILYLIPSVFGSGQFDQTNSDMKEIIYLFL